MPAFLTVPLPPLGARHHHQTTILLPSRSVPFLSTLLTHTSRTSRSARRLRQSFPVDSSVPASFRIAGVREFLPSHRIEVFLAAFHLVSALICPFSLRLNRSTPHHHHPSRLFSPVRQLLSLSAARWHRLSHRRTARVLCVPWLILLLGLAQTSDPGSPTHLATTNAHCLGTLAQISKSKHSSLCTFMRSSSLQAAC